MSRTIRRGNPTRNIHKYIGLDVLTEEKYCYVHWRAGVSDMPYWKDDENDQRTYEEYCADKIRHYHSEKYWKCYTGLPRYVRCLDRNKQKRRHKQAIHNAVRSGDYDVVLESMRHDAEWMWY